MATATRITKSFSIDRDILKRVEGTRGLTSASERVNQLLKAALNTEARQCLYDETAAFFEHSSSETETELDDAFRSAAIATFTRD